ncbi:MAG: ribbon-helix-helix protein, CopG family [Candidatus Bathyarchaeota archaeon]|nr:ribbon-helix-helix protein, CopG family [Candidatus Bathyarchaeota archaeon]MCX8176673.1 ribbon-helix-helix protein, CopG family [Candidatus Bathyarchaeota archaeon]MDW8193200.1 ribbon-helix-helix protein, CopG family [Nitrososphaerota archaeon]
MTVALDPSTANLLEKLSKDERLSQSEIVRRALKFFNENRALTDPVLNRKIHSYMELLLSGEHVILDVDHWVLFLNFLEYLPEQEEFWNEHKKVAQSHCEQLKNKVNTVENLLIRLEDCNFFKVVKNSENDFTLILTSERSKKFVVLFIEEFLHSMGVKFEIKENLAKLNLRVKPLR